MLVHFKHMKVKLSVRAFRDYINKGICLEYRAFNNAWRKYFPEDCREARLLYREKELQYAREQYSEALFQNNGDVAAAEQSLIERLIAPPSFTALSDCGHCGKLPARPSSVGEPSCAWCGLISSGQE